MTVNVERIFDAIRFCAAQSGGFAQVIPSPADLVVINVDLYPILDASYKLPPFQLAAIFSYVQVYALTCGHEEEFGSWNDYHEWSDDGSHAYSVYYLRNPLSADTILQDLDRLVAKDCSP